MIDITTLNIGDTLYHVSKKLNKPSPKIVMIDQDGIEWHRYEDHYKYNIEKLTVSGYVDTIVTGIIGDSYIPPRQFYMYGENGSVESEYYDFEDLFFTTKTFYTEEEAVEYIEKSKKGEII